MPAPKNATLDDIKARFGAALAAKRGSDRGGRSHEDTVPTATPRIPVARKHSLPRKSG